MAKFLTWNDFNNEYDGKPDFNKVTNSTSADIKSTDIFIWGGKFLNDIFKLTTNHTDINLVDDLTVKMITELPSYPIDDTEALVFDKIELSKGTTVFKTINNIDNTNIGHFNDNYKIGYEHPTALSSSQITPTTGSSYIVSASKNVYINASDIYTLTLHVKSSKTFESISASIDGVIYKKELSVDGNTITLRFQCTYANQDSFIINPSTGNVFSGHELKNLGSLRVTANNCNIIRDDGSIIKVQSQVFDFSINAYTPKTTTYVVYDDWKYNNDESNYPWSATYGNIDSAALKYRVNVTEGVYTDGNTKYGVFVKYVLSNGTTNVSYYLKELTGFPNLDLYTLIGQTNNNYAKLKYNLNYKNVYKSINDIVVAKNLTDSANLPMPSVRLYIEDDTVENLTQKGYTYIKNIITKTY